MLPILENGLNRRDEVEKKGADCSPNSVGKITFKEKMSEGFIMMVTEDARRINIVVKAMKAVFGVDAIVDEKPLKEDDTRRKMTVPNARESEASTWMN